MRSTKRLRLASAALLAAALGATGCVNSPTGESDSGLIEVTGTITNVAGEATLTRVTLVVDGNEESPRYIPDAPVVSYRYYDTHWNCGRGGHRLSIRVQQNAASGTYRFSGFVVSHNVVTGFLSWKSDAKVTLPDQTVELGNGAAAVWDFSI